MVAVRVQTRLLLDDLYSVMRDTIPTLVPHSTLHRALQRPVSFADLPPGDRAFSPMASRAGPILHEPRSSGARPTRSAASTATSASSEPLKGKARLFVAVDQTSKLVFARLYRKANKLAAQAFRKVLIRTVPYKIHTIARRSAGGMPGKAGLGSPTTACRSPPWLAPASRSWCTRPLGCAGSTASSTG